MITRILIVSIVLLSSRDAGAQESGFVCDFDARDQSREARLVPYGVTPVPESRLSTKPAWRFGPFDHREYGFDHITFYVEEVGPFEEVLGGDFGPVDIVVRIEGTESAWFRVLPKTSDPEERGAVQAYRGLATIAAATYEGEAIRLASDSGARPLFVVDLDDGDTRSSTRDMFLLDLRPGRKRVPLAFRCVADLIAGACGAYDNSYQFASESIDCQWSRSANDISCRVREGVETTWGARATTWPLPLTGQRDPGIATARASAEPQLFSGRAGRRAATRGRLRGRCAGSQFGFPDPSRSTEVSDHDHPELVPRLRDRRTGDATRVPISVEVSVCSDRR